MTFYCHVCKAKTKHDRMHFTGQGKTVFLEVYNCTKCATLKDAKTVEEENSLLNTHSTGKIVLTNKDIVELDTKEREGENKGSMEINTVEINKGYELRREVERLLEENLLKDVMQEIADSIYSVGLGSKDLPYKHPHTIRRFLVQISEDIDVIINKIKTRETYSKISPGITLQSGKVE